MECITGETTFLTQTWRLSLLDLDLYLCKMRTEIFAGIAVFDLKRCMKFAIDAQNPSALKLVMRRISTRSIERSMWIWELQLVKLRVVQWPVASVVLATSP